MQEKIKQHRRTILKLLQAMSEVQAAGLYSECQKGAGGIAELVRGAVGGEGTRSIALLSKYNELLSKAKNGEIGENILQTSSENSWERGRLARTFQEDAGEPPALPAKNGLFGACLQDILIEIENAIKTELKPNKIEAAFLSYNASMSDSIESIYHAAKADPDCDAYWIPIPFFERNPDGTFEKMRYEGADYYSGDIECTDWREYDITARHPDMIFTFAAYDANNFITSVHPDFYCERLRDLTDCLIYVPYFVAIEKLKVDKQLCTASACVFAHKVIVQSEDVRDIYIDTFKKHYGDMYGKPEDKFIALGSPKFDKLSSSTRDDFTLPDKWRKLIGGKKVIFYNTNIDALLAGNEQYLKKMRSVLAAFRSRADVTLWYRPHPLFEATFSSMRPHLLDESKQIIAEYKNEGWGIYDDTTDLYRAIICSDAYYGDWSSLVAMFQHMNKPVLIQDISDAITDKYEHFKKIQTAELCEHGGYFWGFNYNVNSLYKISKLSWEAEHLGIVPNEEIFTTRLYAAVAEFNGKLYLAPGRANEIAVYDIEKDEFSKIEILPPDEIASTQNSRHLKFCDIVTYENCLYFISCSYPAFIKLNPSTNEVEYYSDWLKPLEKLINVPTAFFFRHTATVIGTRFYLASCNANAVVSFDMDKQTSAIYEVGGKTNGYSDICYDGERFWLSPRSNGPVVYWSPETEQWKEFWDFPDGLIAEKFSYSDIVYCDEHVWFFPYTANIAFKINTKNFKISITQAFQRECERLISDNRNRFNYNYSYAFADGKKIYACTGKSKLLLEYDCETGECVERHIIASNKSMAKILSHPVLGYNSNDIHNYMENRIFSLDDYLNYVNHNEIPPADNDAYATSSGSAGIDIYKYVVNNLI